MGKTWETSNELVVSSATSYKARCCGANLRDLMTSMMIASVTMSLILDTTIMRHLRVFAFSAICLLSLSFTVSAKDEWTEVHSKNFLLVGNAAEKDIRHVATRLEQFRETFRRLFVHMNLTSPISTNVVVFKNTASYTPFKPKKADGKIDEFVAGYFQPGQDVNYITLSADTDDQQMFRVIFHEYVHFIVGTNFGKSEIPPWFNEGLAEYYETFEIADDQKVKLGYAQPRHLEMLRRNDLVPLDQLFGVSNYQLLQTGDHSRSIFYAESWALLHYFLQNGKDDGLSKFIAALMRDEPAKKAFESAFQMTYPQMESELHKYVANGRYKYSEFLLRSKLLFDDSMTSQRLTDSLSDAYLGDLLVHTNRADDAEPFLQRALKIDPDSSIANTAMGMVKMRQEKFSDARVFLEKAIMGDRAGYLALYQYAYLLSREAMDGLGMVHTMEKATGNKMRDVLKRAIAINPEFTDSYELLAFVNVVRQENLDEAIGLLKTALKYQPGNQRYALRMGEVLAVQEKFKEAAEIAEKISKTTDDPEIKSRAEYLVRQIDQMKRQGEILAANQKRSRQDDASGPLSEAEMAKRQEDALYYSITEAIGKAAAGEIRVIGRISKIECARNSITYSVKTGDDEFVLTSKDFQNLSLNTFNGSASGVNVGCGENISALNAVVTYSVARVNSKGSRGVLLALHFVPEGFHFVTSLNEPGTSELAVDPERDLERRAEIIETIKKDLKAPAAGEKRIMAFLERIECTETDFIFEFRSAGGIFRLTSPPPKSLAVRLFTRDLGGISFGCELKPVAAPAVILYTERPDKKLNTMGSLISIDFVPKFFALD
jgi:predicted Zn-dependent protease